MEAEKRILIIEDDTDIAMIEEAYLSASGFETKVLSDGLHVKEVLEKENFDLNLQWKRGKPTPLGVEWIAQNI